MYILYLYLYLYLDLDLDLYLDSYLWRPRWPPLRADPRPLVRSTSRVHWRYGTTVHAAAGSHRCQGHRSYVPTEDVCGPKIVVRVWLSRCYRVVVDSCPREITLGSLMRSAGPRVPRFVIC
jgi:hypothetical protein